MMAEAKRVRMCFDTATRPKTVELPVSVWRLWYAHYILASNFQNMSCLAQGFHAGEQVKVADKATRQRHWRDVYRMSEYSIQNHTKSTVSRSS